MKSLLPILCLSIYALLETDHVHGGAVASALDDILGTMVWRSVGYSRAGIPTMQLTVKYRGPIPLRKQLRLDTKVVKWEGRKVRRHGRHPQSSW